MSNNGNNSDCRIWAIIWIIGKNILLIMVLKPKKYQSYPKVQMNYYIINILNIEPYFPKFFNSKNRPYVYLAIQQISLPSRQWILDIDLVSPILFAIS